MLSDYNGNKLEVNNRRSPNSLILDCTLIYNTLVKDKVSEEVKKYF